MPRPCRGTGHHGLRRSSEGVLKLPIDSCYALRVLRYSFTPVEHCEMCASRNFRQLGMRLNRSQGMRPREADGIAVSVKQCRDCDLIFADPQPMPNQLSDHYDMSPEDYWGRTPAWTPEYFATEIAAAKRLLPFADGMTALDIGAGQGLAMQSLIHAGFDVWGIEPTETFYQYASPKMKPGRLMHAAVETAEFDAESFDFITFGAVLEHLYSPSLALGRAMGWLKPGGIIQAEVPNARWLIAKLVNGYFRLRGTNYVTHISPMHPPFHLYEFTDRSFRRFEVAERVWSVCEIPYFPRLLHSPLRWLMDRTRTGMQLTVYLRK